MNVVEIVAWPAADAFLEVIVFVALMMGIFNLLHWRLGARLPRYLETHWRLGPLLGAALGVVPGCGGAIFVMPLYARRQVSFGTVIAALVATMGDSSFVLIAAEPRLAVVVHAMLFIVGVATGYLVDVARYAPAPRRELVTVGSGESPNVRFGGGDGAGEQVCEPAATEPDTAGGRDGWAAPLVFWTLVVVGAALTTGDLVRGRDPLEQPGSLGVFGAVGLAGTVLTIGLALTRRRAVRRSGACCHHVGLSEVVHSTAYDAARIGTWIAVVFVAFVAVVEVGPSVLLLATLAGLGGVVAGAALGLVPGCGPQVIMTGMFVSGMLPFPTLVANALSQDGDALLPLLLVDRQAALVANVLTMLPGLVGGGVVLLLGVGP